MNNRNKQPDRVAYFFQSGYTRVLEILGNNIEIHFRMCYNKIETTRDISTYPFA